MPTPAARAKKRWREKNPEKMKAARASWEENNPDYHAEYREAHKDTIQEQTSAWKRDNKVKVRGYHLRAKFGLTLEDYEHKLESQGFVCAICQEPYDKSYHVDHDHETGAIRGLLCNTCNLGLGYFKDSAKNLSSATRYINFHKELN